MIARRVGRFLERQGLLERDAENSYLAGEAVEAGPLDQWLGHSITYRIAVGPQAGRKVFTLRTLPACDPEESFGERPAKEGRAGGGDDAKVSPGMALPQVKMATKSHWCQSRGSISRDSTACSRRTASIGLW
jgi:hypothetical protein